jgi:hypothetical protein
VNSLTSLSCLRIRPEWKVYDRRGIKAGYRAVLPELVPFMAYGPQAVDQNQWGDDRPSQGARWLVADRDTCDQVRQSQMLPDVIQQTRHQTVLQVGALGERVG